MKIFWKVFLSIITVTISVFCVSGHFLIGSFFDSFLQNEIETAKQVNLSLCYSLVSTINKQQFEYEPEVFERVVGRSARTINVQRLEKIIQFCVYNDHTESIYKMVDFETLPADEGLLKKVTDDVTGYEIQKQGGRYYLYIANMVLVNEQKLYMETVSDITDIFTQKDKQYEIFVQCMLMLGVIITVLVMLLSLWISSPIRRLSQAVKEIGQGNFSEEIYIKNQDEIGVLAREFNRMSKRLKTNMEELREAAARQEEFTGSFAHELKTPLTSIIGYADMLRSKKMTEETRMIYGDYIFQQGKRLEKLSKKMLELIVLDKTDFEMREIYLEELYEQLKNELWPMLKERRIRFETSGGDVILKVEPTLLKTVFTNMIDNSAKAIGKEGYIVIQAQQIDQRVFVFIMDNGKGIPQKDIAKVTESFYMVDKSRKYEGGSVGLGLAICKRILELHRATFEIESREGEGTKVTICFEVGE